MFIALFSFLILQRIAELVLAERNRRWAMGHGGCEHCGSTYPVIVAVHALFYLSLALEWRYRSNGWNLQWPLWLVLVMVAQLMRVWSIRCLGRHWNTRIITVPEVKLIRQGPYRYVRHPNYAVVMVELLAIPMLCGAYITAAVFSVANALILAVRIPEEERALEEAVGTALPHLPRFVPRLFHPRRAGPQHAIKGPRRTA